MIGVSSISPADGGGSHAHPPPQKKTLNSKLIFSIVGTLLFRICNLAMKTNVPRGTNLHIFKMAAIARLTYFDISVTIQHIFVNFLTHL